MLDMSATPWASIIVVVWLSVSFGDCFNTSLSKIDICSSFSVLTKPLDMGTYPVGGLVVSTVWMDSTEKPSLLASSV